MSIHVANLRRALLVVSTAALLVGGLAALPSTAAAIPSIDVVYCDAPTPPNSPCGTYHGPAFRSDNNSRFPGWRVSRSVCEKLLLGADWSLQERICGPDWVQGTYAYSLSSWGWSTIAFSGNNSPWTHQNVGSSIVWAYGPNGLRSAPSGDSSQRDLLRQAALSAASSNTGPLKRGEPVPLEEVAAATERFPTVPAEKAPAAALRSISALRSAESGKVATINRVDDQVTLRTTAERLCLSTSATGGQITCQDYDKIGTGDMMAAAHCGLNVPANTVLLYGVVPDGVTAVTVTNTKGAAIATSDVTRNTYRVAMPTDVARGADSLRWSGKTDLTKSLAGIVGPDAGC